MKKLFLLLFSFCWFFSAQAQRPTVEPFVLGLLDDYQGRKWSKDDSAQTNLVDKFHATEYLVVKYLDSLITLENKRTYDKVFVKMRNWNQPNCFYCHEFKQMHSAKLAKDLNKHYSFKAQKEADGKGQRILVGTLKRNLFKTPKDRLSFLAGAFVRYGNRENHLYQYKLTGSASKYDVIVKELKALNCSITDEEGMSETSHGQVVTFIPSNELRAYLDKHERLRLAILAKKEMFAKEQRVAFKSYDFFSSHKE
jgi:hypothetical protein